MRKQFAVAVVAASLALLSPDVQLGAQTTGTRAHVAALAGNGAEGRLTGSKGEQVAADYIVAQLKRIGARPLPGRTDYRMEFEFTAGASDGGSEMSAVWKNGSGSGEFNAPASGRGQ